MRLSSVSSAQLGTGLFIAQGEAAAVPVTRLGRKDGRLEVGAASDHSFQAPSPCCGTRGALSPSHCCRRSPPRKGPPLPDAKGLGEAAGQGSRRENAGEDTRFKNKPGHRAAGWQHPVQLPLSLRLRLPRPSGASVAWCSSQVTALPPEARLGHGEPAPEPTRLARAASAPEWQRPSQGRLEARRWEWSGATF